MDGGSTLVLCTDIAGAGECMRLPMATFYGSMLAGMMLAGCSAPMPKNLGVHAGRLTPCPSSPNCVCSQDHDKQHAIAPFAYNGPRPAAMARLAAAIRGMYGARIVEQTDDYLHAEYTTRWLRFVDDVEFYVPADAGLIQVRSASRVGYSDFGVNRKRVEAIRHRFEAATPK
jgi:uncharacterized protein (DUF1499 family)